MSVPLHEPYSHARLDPTSARRAPHVLFGGSYGVVLTGSMVAAPSEPGETAASDRLTSVL